MLSRAVFTARQLGAPGDIGGCLHEMGALRLAAGDLDSATTLFAEALEQRRSAGDLPGQAATTHQIGVVSETRGDTLAALDHYQQSLALCEQMGDNVGRVANLLRLGAVYQQRRRWAEAERALGSAVEVARARGRADLLAAALRRLGGVQYARGAAGDAFTALWQAHTLAPDPEMDVWMRGLREGMGPEVFAALAAQLGVPADLVREIGEEPAPPPSGDPPLSLAELVAVRLRVGPDEFARLAEKSALPPDVRARVDQAARGLET
jgi:tetratricopeptide (TPR) repeat protein